MFRIPIFILLILPLNLISQNNVELIGVKVTNPRFYEFKNVIKITGSILANESVEITSVISEKIKKIKFNEGSFVNKNEILVVLENSEEYALLKQVKAELEESNINFLRAKKLFEEGNTSQAILDRRLKDKKKLEGRLDEVQAKIDDLILRAPFDGILGTKNFSEGSFLKPGDVIVGIYDIEQVKVKINIPEKYSLEIKAGQEFHVTVPTKIENILKGKLYAVDPVIDRETRTFVALGSLENKKQDLKPGMMVNIKIIFNSTKRLSIPEGAIIPEDDETYVFTVNKDNIIEKKKLKIDKRENGIVEVLSGLSKDENVVFEGTNKIRIGTKVKVLR